MQGNVWLQLATSARPSVDMGTKGIDELGIGSKPAVWINFTLEKETSAPFCFPLKIVIASIRLKDPDTRQLQQISAVSEFGTK
jgi:hypothetical protein